MIFGGFNPSQYAKDFIFQNGEKKEKYEIGCGLDLWQEIAETFGKNATVIRNDGSEITIKIMSVPTEITSWVLKHIDKCNVTGPKKFREEIQRIIIEAYKKYCE